MKKDTCSQYVSITSRVRFPRTARNRIFASTTRALPGIPLLLAGSRANLLIFLHQLVLAGTPGSDHFVQLFGGCPHRIELRLAASFLRRDIEAERLTVSRDGERGA